MATNTFIALLRGINVSGCNKIKMTELQQLFIELGFDDVTSFYKICATEKSEIFGRSKSLVECLSVRYLVQM